MSDSSSHSSQQVEKIREILVGRQLGVLEQRLGSLEAAIKAHRGHADGEILEGAQSAHASVLEGTEELRRQLREEAQIHSDQIARLTEQLNAASHQLEETSSKLVDQDRHVEQHLSEQLEHISSAMAARIDARVREVLQHLQSEIAQWKHQLDRELLAVRHTKIDRQEVRSRFARLAAAAMEDPPPPETPREDRASSFECPPIVAVTELPTTPFPELRPLDEKRRVPSLSDLLRSGPGFPAPAGPGAKPAGPELPVLPFGSTDAAVVAAEAPQPAQPTQPTQPAQPAPAGQFAESLASLMDDDRPHAGGSTLPPIADIVPGRDDAPAATDADLAAALTALLEPALDRAPTAGSHAALHTYLEPMLRNTVRRAIAEQLQASSQFTEIGTLDRLAWRLRAIFSSRTYDEIVFERTRRYQVEEVYLVRKKDRGLISYAVHDPALHGAPRRIQPHLRRLTSRIREQDGSFETSLDLPEHRVGLVREGKHSLLLAVIRGRSNALVRADLDFIHRQIEDQFGSRIETRSDAFIHVLQPILEGALLIQSPAPPR